MKKARMYQVAGGGLALCYRAAGGGREERVGCWPCSKRQGGPGRRAGEGGGGGPTKKGQSGRAAEGGRGWADSPTKQGSGGPGQDGCPRKKGQACQWEALAP